MRIAVVDLSRCKPKDCDFLCIRVCPIVKTGGEAIAKDEESGKVRISEELCTGCGICPKKCPFGAIEIINLPQELGEPVHQYGVNGFRLYNLPTPKEGVVGIVGANGVGKTTALRILAGELKPNLGSDADWREIVERFRGKELQNHLEALASGKMKSAYKPQYVDAIAKHVKGKVKDVLAKADESGRLPELASILDLKNSMNKDVSSLSGGELQRMAIAACLSKEADIYFLDEPSSYLDVRERLNTAKAIRLLSGKKIFVVEHDLVVLDYLSDYIHVIFGTPRAYGIVSGSNSVRVGINEYLGGFLKSENMRFREGIKFEVKPPSKKTVDNKVAEYPAFSKTYDSFKLKVDAGELHEPSIVGILGANATGKTTFAKILAGVEKPDKGELDLKVVISYKPQYVKSGSTPVADLKIKESLVEMFNIRSLLDRRLDELSGGELQKVAIADCLSKSADIYLLDEPSAYLDVEERLKLAKNLGKFSHENGKSVLVIDHDILLVDYLSTELMVFSGEGGKSGHASKPTNLRTGMNSFLKTMDTTFRREPESGRPRANKPDSVKDREQKQAGEYYYT
jgi:ATP-binding cassette subfamily E protein 1